jgi:hypothetical protein
MQFAVITCYHVYIKESIARISTVILQVATDFPYVYSNATVYYYQVVVEGVDNDERRKVCLTAHLVMVGSNCHLLEVCVHTLY